MADGRKDNGKAEAREWHAPRFDPNHFEATKEFANFKAGVKRLLAVPKAVVDARVKAAKEASPRVGNPKAAGRKKWPDG